MPLDRTALNALVRKFASDRAGLDEEENLLRTNYRVTVDDLLRGNKQNASSLAANMADRGMTHSGANIQSNLDLREAYNRNAGNASQQVNSLLSTIARKKLEAEAEFNEQRTLAERGLI